jgi:hypothetical protein
VSGSTVRQRRLTYLVHLAVAVDIPFFSIHLINIGPSQGESKGVKDTAHDTSGML